MKFTQISGLKSYQRFKHTFEKPFECTDCDVKFATGSNLKRHQGYKHTLKETFKSTEHNNKLVENGIVPCH